MSNILSNSPPGYVASIRALSPMGSGVLMIGGSLISFANVLAAFSVCYSCLVRPRIDRMPHLCAAIVELLLGALTIASLVYSMMHDVLMPPTACTAVGFLTHLTVSVDIAIALCLAIGAWARLNYSYRSKTGRYDWKIWISVLVIPVVLPCAVLGMNGFGDDIFWCHVQPTTTGATIGLASLIAINYITLALVTYFHFSGISRQHQVSNLSYTVGMGTIETQRRRQSLAEPINILTPNQPSSMRGLYPPSSAIGFDMPSPALMSATMPPPKRKTGKGLTMYNTIHFLQHTPTTLYCICTLSGFQAWWVYFLFVAGFHVGGIAKAILFHQQNRGTAKETRTQRSMQGRSLAVPSTAVHPPPSELERPVPTWLGSENRLSHMWASNSTLATVNSSVPTMSTSHRTPSFTIQNAYQFPVVNNNNTVTRQSVYPDTTTYPFRHNSVSFGTTSDSSGAPSAVASRRNVDVAPLTLNESSKNTINQRASAPMKIQLDSDDDDEEDIEPLQSQRAERVSMRP